ncbi:MAG TPA: DapH/DapD/GlmU-related protein [Opitutaceae bacterium]|nr:DapH/DapD/GlmU-related protein [Opitutaceae bacterium]
MVVDSDFHNLWPPETRRRSPGFERDADVSIGENVWVGARSIILKGVTIGDNAVIGAGSLVTRSVPPNTLAVGNPARVVKTYGDTAGRVDQM